MNKELMDEVIIDGGGILPSLRIDIETKELLNKLSEAIPVSKTNIRRLALKHYLKGVLAGTIQIGKFKLGNEIGAYVSKGNGGCNNGKHK